MTSSYLPEDQRRLLPPGAGPFERHVFVCVFGKTCPNEGAEAVHAAMKDMAKGRLGKHRGRGHKSGCLGQCGHGPMVAVYPDGVWYAHVRVEDVPEIVESHLEGGRPLERLLFRGHRIGNNALVKE